LSSFLSWFTGSGSTTASVSPSHHHTPYPLCPGTIMRKLFHPHNALKMRQFGIRLLVLWIQALQENAGEACTELFASVVPHFPPDKTPLGLPVNRNLATPSKVQEYYGVYSNSPTRTDVSIPRSQSISGAAIKGIVSPLY